MTKEQQNAKLKFERKDLELEFTSQRKLREDELLLNHVFDETELPDWE
ncbi:MAG TPA: hypothetical protein VIM94_08660 [Salegentibacter sp.]